MILDTESIIAENSATDEDIPKNIHSWWRKDEAKLMRAEPAKIWEPKVRGELSVRDNVRDMYFRK